MATPLNESEQSININIYYDPMPLGICYNIELYCIETKSEN